MIAVAFFFGFVLFTIGETEWLNRRTGSGVVRSLLITLPSNIFGVCFGYVFAYWVMLVALGVVLRATSPGEVERAWDGILWITVVLVLVVPPLAIVKRLLLKVTKIEASPRPWTYSFLAALAFHVMVLGVFYLTG